jgi:hypothetical protein
LLRLNTFLTFRSFRPAEYSGLRLTDRGPCTSRRLSTERCSVLFSCLCICYNAFTSSFPPLWRWQQEAVLVGLCRPQVLIAPNPCCYCLLQSWGRLIL